MFMDWRPHLSINFLDSEIRDFFRLDAEYLLTSLESAVGASCQGVYKVGVTLIEASPSKYPGHLLRESMNPEWYRKLYNERAHCERRRSIAALRRIIDLNDPEYREIPAPKSPDHFTWVTTYRNLILRRLTGDYREFGKPVAAQPKALDYFGITPEEIGLRSVAQQYPDEVPF
jgi:hypothetical protein